MKKLVLLLLCLLPAASLMGQVDSVQVSLITFTGNNSFDDVKLRALMSVQASSWFSTYYFEEDILHDDLEIIKSFYIHEGFFQVNIDDYTLSYSEDRSQVDISIFISEGQPIKVDTIKFIGNKHFSDQLILENLGLRSGERYQHRKINKAKIKIKKMYRNAGFLNAHSTVDIKFNKELYHCELSFDIQENERFIINEIHIDGLEKSKSHIVLRELEVAPNQFINLDQLLKSQRNLYRTGLFSSVSIKPVATADSAEAQKDILIKLQEADPGEFDVAVGFGTIEKFRISSELSYKNIFGSAYRAMLGGKISMIEKKIESSITDPWIFGIPWGLSLGGAIGTLDEPSYSISYLNGKLNFYTDFLERSKFGFTAAHGKGTYDELRFSLFEKAIGDSLTAEEEAQARYFISNIDMIIQRSSLKVTLLYDLRNHIFDPSRGYYIDLSSEFIYGISDVDTFNVLATRSYNKILRTEAIIKYFYLIEDLGTFASTLNVGFINDFSDQEVIFLLNDLFYAGGPNALRGFEYKRVGPLAENGNPLGGMLKLVWNLIEIRRRIYWIFGGVIFFDVGNVWRTPQDFKLKNLRYSPGLGLRIDTPIGLARIDYGFNPWPKSGESSGQYWIGIGHAF